MAEVTRYFPPMEKRAREQATEDLARIELALALVIREAALRERHSDLLVSALKLARGLTERCTGCLSMSGDWRGQQ